MFDITKTIYCDMPVYPGDPEVKILRCRTIKKDNFNLFQVCMSNHTIIPQGI